MNRILGLFAAAGVLLSACGGGGIQSPDFTPVLQGINITYPGKTASSVATVTPGGSLQFSAVGLYSTPPGTAASNNTVACQTASNGIGVCTLGQISGVSWSVDPVSGNTGAVATVDNTGKATGARRGNATIRAKAGGFEATDRLLVSGAVLESVQITPTPSDSVPTGRSITLKATPLCADQGTTSNANCVPGKVYNYSWALPSTFPAGTVEFTSGTVGESVVVKTKRFGKFTIDVSTTNEEGTRVMQSSPQLDATERVLEDILVSADPAQNAPVPIVVGTKTRFVARGLFSDGAIDDIRAADVKAPLTWTADGSSVGKITIEEQKDANGAVTSPNSAVLVSGDQVGTTGLTVNGRNIETTGASGPNGLQLSDRIGLEVKTFGLVGLADICPFDSVGDACAQNLQLPLNSRTKFKARGFFSDSPRSARDIDPTKIALTWGKSTTASTGDVDVVGAPNATTGEYTATRAGPVTLTVALTNAQQEPNATPRTVSANALIIEPICREQFFASNGTTSAVSSTNVTNAGSVIDTDPNSFGTITLTSPSLLGGDDEFMSFQRAATLVTPTTTPAQTAGFIIAYDRDVFSPDSLAKIQTLNASGAVVQDLTVSSSQLSSIPQRNGETLVAAKVTPTLPFTGMRFTVTPPDPTAPVPIPVVGDLLALLLGGGETDVHVYAACSSFSN